MARVNTGTATGTDEASSGYESVLEGDESDSDSDSGTDEEITVTEETVNEAVEKRQQQSDKQKTVIMVRVDAFAPDGGKVDGTIIIEGPDGSKSKPTRRGARFQRFDYYVERGFSYTVLVNAEQGQDKVVRNASVEAGEVSQHNIDVQLDPEATAKEPDQFKPQESTEVPDDPVEDSATDEFETTTESESEDEYDPLYRTYDQYGGDDVDEYNWDDYEQATNETVGGSDSSDADNAAVTDGRDNRLSIAGILALIVAGLALAWRILMG